MGYIVLGMVLFLADLIIKRKAEEKLKFKHEKEICSGKIVLKKLHNTGMMNSFLAGKERIVLLLQGMTAVISAVFFFVALIFNYNTWIKIGLSLINAGGWNNLLDRWKHHYVRDYLILRPFGKRKRELVYNVSDFAIFLGAFFTAVGYLLWKEKK